MNRTVIALIIFISFSCIPDDKTAAVRLKDTAQGDGVIGIDVSHHQKEIDWTKVKKWNGKKIEFVYVKATEGATYQDKKYSFNFYQAKKQGIPVGSYHYFRTTSSIEDQFKNFKKRVNKNEQDLLPLIDVEERKEWDKNKFQKNLKKFLTLIEEHYGVKPMLYSVNSFYNRNLAGHFDGYKMMIGRYGKNSPFMKTGQDWTIWQFSEKGKIDGVVKSVDINMLNEQFSLEDLMIKK